MLCSFLSYYRPTFQLDISWRCVPPPHRPSTTLASLCPHSHKVNLRAPIVPWPSYSSFVILNTVPLLHCFVVYVLLVIYLLSPLQAAHFHLPLKVCPLITPACLFVLRDYNSKHVQDERNKLK